MFNTNQTTNAQDSKKCYNSISCILSVLVIIFVVGAIAWDTLVSKPKIRQSIEEIRMEVRDIHEKIDKQYAGKNIAFTIPRDSTVTSEK